MWVSWTFTISLYFYFWGVLSTPPPPPPPPPPPVPTMFRNNSAVASAFLVAVFPLEVYQLCRLWHVAGSGWVHVSRVLGVRILPSFCTCTTQDMMVSRNCVKCWWFCHLSADRLIVCTGEKAGMVLSYGFLISTLAQQYLSALSFFSFTGWLWLQVMKKMLSKCLVILLPLNLWSVASFYLQSDFHCLSDISLWKPVSALPYNCTCMLIYLSSCTHTHTHMHAITLLVSALPSPLYSFA